MIGDISPVQIFHRQREAQNRGFGDISPEMATLGFIPFHGIVGRSGTQSWWSASRYGHCSAIAQPSSTRVRRERGSEEDLFKTEHGSKQQARI